MGVAIIGCGAIGSYLARSLDKGIIEDLEVKVLYDKILERARSLSSSLSCRPRIAETLQDVTCSEDVSLVIEAASQEAVRSYALEILESGKSLMIMSVGALADPDLFRRLKKMAETKGVRLYIPSGAIAGLDAVKAAGMAGISRVTLTSRKPLRVFEGNPYIKSKGIDLSRLEEPIVVYEGSASEACRLFPFSINVAATLSLASIGPERVRVRIIADPRAQGNIHEVVVEGDFGRLECRTINKPTPENPKTSFLAALSALATLKKAVDKVHIGT
ncbi:aspartate dehydrogenase [Candidatus Bathyarchaeota archaeon]|nr:MAG: aspartate dehydrogenase [Candidatus Bathyarchaeota archaeon]